MQPDWRFAKSIRLPPEAYENRDATFHVVVSSQVGNTPFSGLFGDAFWDNLLGQRETGRVVLYAACLMPDHLHLLASPGTESLLAWVDAFKTFTTTISWRYGNHGPLWQPSFYDRQMRSARQFGAVLSYIARNPETAGLVENAFDWPWLEVWAST